MANIKQALASVLGLASARAEIADDLVVHPEPEPQEPITSVERFTMAVLREKGAQPLRDLVEWVACQLYREELCNGATTLDIGLFGSRLFVPDVIGELKARNGSLWRIEKAE